MMLGVYVSIEPAPFDVAALAIAGYLFVHRRLRMPAATLLPVALLMIFGLANLVSLVMVRDPTPAIAFMAITFYLMALWVLIVAAQGYRSVEAMDAMLWGYSIGAGIAAALGIAAYLGFPGLREVMAPRGRLWGMFKDANVYGAYLVPAALYGVAQLIGQRTRHRLLWVGVVLACAGAVFLSFSRGAWGNIAAASGIFFVLFTFAAGFSRTWWRAMIVAPVLLVGAAVVTYQLLSVDAISEMFEMRFGLQSYDTLRFSNQQDVLTTALEHPLGLGPGATEREFQVAAHSVYIWALMETGLLGFLSLVGLMVVSVARATWLAVSARSLQHRLVFAVIAASLCAMYGEAAIIDVIHWRHFWVFLAFAWCPAPPLRSMDRAGARDDVRGRGALRRRAPS
jgi:O-antigen ligase